MGTSYTIYKDNNTEFSIDEMSNKLQLSVVDKKSRSFSHSKELEPEKMLKIFMTGIMNISYWIDEETFWEIFSRLKVYPF